MGFAHWFWRLFFLFTGLIAAHVLVVTLLVQRVPGTSNPADTSLWPIWIVGALAIVAGAVATAYCVRRIVEPLADLMRHVQSASPPDNGQLVIPRGGDELGILTGAFSQMQRDLAGRLDQIHHHSQRLQTVLGSMAEGVLAVGPDKTILLANDAARKLLDFATPDPIGRTLLEVTRARPVSEAVHQAFQSPDAVVTEFDAPGLLRRTLSLRATRLPGSPCPGIVIVLHDMTELRRLESLRRELVANVSHELKTPLAAIKGYAETLRLGAVNDTEHNVHFVRRIEEQADRLHELILDILQIARLESGQESFELTSVPVADLLEECANQFAEAAAAKKINLTCEPAERSLAAWADEEGVRTILTNLIDNAIKYTSPGGSVTLRAFPDGNARLPPSQSNSLTLEVSDTGIGIAEKDLPRIFERFYRVDKARSRELGGTGLGLSIVKHLAQSFGGHVSVESQLHRGSTFRIQLPCP